MSILNDKAYPWPVFKLVCLCGILNLPTGLNTLNIVYFLWIIPFTFWSATIIDRMIRLYALTGSPLVSSVVFFLLPRFFIHRKHQSYYWDRKNKKGYRFRCQEWVFFRQWGWKILNFYNASFISLSGYFISYTLIPAMSLKSYIALVVVIILYYIRISKYLKRTKFAENWLENVSIVCVSEIRWSWTPYFFWNWDLHVDWPVVELYEEINHAGKFTWDVKIHPELWPLTSSEDTRFMRNLDVDLNKQHVRFGWVGWRHDDLPWKWPYDEEGHIKEKRLALNWFVREWDWPRGYSINLEATYGAQLRSLLNTSSSALHWSSRNSIRRSKKNARFLHYRPALRVVLSLLSRYVLPGLTRLTLILLGLVTDSVRIIWFLLIYFLYEIWKILWTCCN